jgi:hypothetical protein
MDIQLLRLLDLSLLETGAFKSHNIPTKLDRNSRPFRELSVAVVGFKYFNEVYI